MLAQDLLSLDGEVERVHRAWTRASVDLARDPEAHADDDPFGSRRVAANKSTRDELLASTPGAHEVTLRDALVRWVAFLVVARLTYGDDVEVARAAAAPHAVLHLEPPRRVTLREARGQIAAASARSAAEGGAWLAAFAEAAPRVAPPLRERRARRTEVLLRLDLDPQAPFGPVPVATLDALAEAIVHTTDDVALASLREARRREDLGSAPLSPLDAVRTALARQAGEGWPARLTRRWLEELFGAHTRGLDLDVPLPREALGASSFVRALETFGSALRQGGSRGSPFALRRDPEPLDAYRVGAAFALAAASSPFHVRALGTSAHVAAAQARAVTLTLLLSLRGRAVAWLLFRDAGRFEELTTRLFGAPLPASLAGVWPLPRHDCASRLVGAALGPDLARELVDRHDEDWFRNPRAFAELRARASLPAREPVLAPNASGAVDFVDVVARLSRDAERALG